MQLFNSANRMPPANGAAKSSRREPQGLHLLLTRARSEVSRRGRGSVVAFTAAHPGAGVSHVVNFFAEKLAAQTGKRTVVLDAPRLQDLRVADFMNLSRFTPASVPNLWLLSEEPSNGSSSREPRNSMRDEFEWGLEPLQALSANFSYSLIDCPSIDASYDVEMLAPDVDGVVLVVEADRTKRDQILRARRTIEMANGKVMALVLNKRKHVVPEWIYRRL